MKERILAYCKMKGITPNAFETKAGWSPSTIYNLKKGVRSDKLADAAIAFPDLNIRWLLTGKGEPIYEVSCSEVKEVGDVNANSMSNEGLRPISRPTKIDIYHSDVSITTGIGIDSNLRFLQKKIDLLTEERAQYLSIINNLSKK